MLKLSRKAPTPARKGIPITEVSDEMAAAAQQYADASTELAETRALLELARADLMAHVGPLRAGRMAVGDSSSIRIATKGQPITIIWQDRYSGLKTTDRAALIDAFGDSYNQYVVEKETISLKNDTTHAMIVGLIGEEAADKLAPLLNIRETLVPAKGSQKMLAQALTEGSPMAEDLGVFVGSCAAAPQIRCR